MAGKRRAARAARMRLYAMSSDMWYSRMQNMNMEGYDAGR
jgi:hypothetical protein